jgi:smad nuclear-interacting protein 1
MARELSPFSQRRLLTQQLARGEVPTAPRVVAERAGKEAERPSKEPERAEKDASREPERAGEKAKRASKDPSVASRRRSRSRSRERRHRDRSRDRRPKDASPAATAASSRRGREGSPEPYRKRRDESRERRRSREGRRDTSKDRRRDRSRDRRRDGSRDSKRRDRSVEKQPRDRRADGNRRRDRSQDRDRHRDKDRHSRRDRSRSRDRRRRDRSRDDKLAIRERKHRTRSPSASRSPPPKRRRRSRSRSRSPPRSPHQRNKKPLPDQEVSFRGVDNSDQAPTKYGGAPVNKEKPNFKATGALAKHANRVEGTKISLKYHEPAEARKPPPSQPWRIFVFKGDDVIDTIELWQKSCWLLGRSHEVVDYVLEHPSSSGQHAVIQFRYITKVVEDEFGVKSTRGRVKPYVLDLESSNGTELNGKDIEPSRYCELRDKDILRFAGSEREYVVMLPPPEEKKE